MQVFAVSDAAAVLNVSEVQVGRLIAQGEIIATKWGRAWMIDAASVHRYAALRPERGRPFEQQRAWDELLVTQVGSMKKAKALAVVARRHSVRHSVRVVPGMVEKLRRDSRVVLSGVDAAQAHGAHVSVMPPLDLYVRSKDLAGLMKKYVSAENVTDPNVIIRSVETDVLQQFGKYVPLIVALVDLIAEGDTRSAQEVLHTMR
jgi:excisionase family DNA binding protein